MILDKFIDKIEKELSLVAEKGLTNANLEATCKLVDIYKKVKESEYYQNEIDCFKGGDYGMRPWRDERDFYRNDRYDNDYSRGGYDREGRWEARGSYNSYPYMDERSKRYIDRMMEGVDSYNEGKERYRHGEKDGRMVDGIEMTMAAVCMFVESLAEFAETSQEKEIIRKHIEKMKKI